MLHEKKKKKKNVIYIKGRFFFRDIYERAKRALARVRPFAKAGSIKVSLTRVKVPQAARRIRAGSLGSLISAIRPFLTTIRSNESSCTLEDITRYIFCAVMQAAKKIR